MQLHQDTLDFCERWRQKGAKYSMDEPPDCFDRFFTAFALYNCLYNEVNRRCHLRLQGDKNTAIAAAKGFLTSKVIVVDKIIHDCSIEISTLIQRNEFYVWNENSDSRSEPVKNLRSPNPDEQVDGLLKIIYGIRCNMFHGEKEFVARQCKILTPCIRVIEKLNDLIIEKMKADGLSWATCQQ